MSESIRALVGQVKMYSTRFCPYCVAARRLLQQLGVVFEDVSVDNDAKLRREVMQLCGQRTVPQIWVGEQHIGGYTELAALHQQGGLLPLLGA